MNQVTLQLLEISKQLASSTKHFTLTFKNKDIDFSFSGQGIDNNPKHPDHVKKKSPSQKKSEFKRRKLFLEKKLEKYNMSLKLSDGSNTKIHTKELAPPLKCDDCEL